MTLAERYLAALREDKTRLSIAYTDALRDGAPSWQLANIRAEYEHVTQTLTRRMTAR